MHLYYKEAETAASHSSPEHGISVQHPTDEQLLERIRSGDAAAFPELYRRYSPRLYSYCFRLLRDGQSAEDAVQETLMKVHSEQRFVNDPRLLRGWIFTIARNEVFGMLRKKRAVPLGDDDVVWEKETPFELLLQSEEKEIVEHVLGELKPEYREIILLREYESLSYEEIASVTSTTISAVKSRLFKARKALVKKLRPLFQERKLT